MSDATLFTASSLIAGIGWIIMIFFSTRWKDYDKLVIGLVCVILSVVYAWMNFSAPILQTMKDFQSFEGVMRIFQNGNLVIAAWTHILAFDLVGAVWMKKDSLQRGIPHGWMVPVFVLTIVFGPMGLLAYLLLRLLRK